MLGGAPFLGQVPLRAKAAPVLHASPLLMPLRPSYAPPAPDLGADRPRLGDLSWERFPTSILFITGGAAGLFVSGALDTTTGMILKAAGVAAIGWGAYHLLAGPPAGNVERPADKTQLPQKTPSAPAFQMFQGSIISPVDGSKPDLNTWTWTNNFDARIVWYNGSNEDANFTYDILANASVAPGIPVAGQTWISKVVYTGTIKELKPGNDTGPLTITIPVIQPPQIGVTGRGLPLPEVYMYLQLRKIDQKGNPVPTGDPVRVGPFEYK